VIVLEAAVELNTAKRTLVSGQERIERIGKLAARKSCVGAAIELNARHVVLDLALHAVNARLGYDEHDDARAGRTLHRNIPIDIGADDVLDGGIGQQEGGKNVLHHLPPAAFRARRAAFAASRLAVRSTSTISVSAIRLST